MKPQDIMREKVNRLEAEGWLRRSIAEEPRLGELIDLYIELGFDVKLMDCWPEVEQSEDCTSCLMQNPEKYKIIYTREKPF